MTAFQSTKQLIHRILFATAIPHSAVFLALWYIFRLPISPQTVVYAQDTARARFRDSLKNGSTYLIEGYMMRVFTAGIMLADKWVNDQTFQLRTWCATVSATLCILRTTFLGMRSPAYPKPSCAISKSRLWVFWNTTCASLGMNGRCGWDTSHLGTPLWGAILRSPLIPLLSPMPSLRPPSKMLSGHLRVRSSVAPQSQVF